MKVSVRRCSPQDLAPVVELAEAVFVRERGRTGSLAQRYPSVFCPERVQDIYIASSGGHICAALVAKPFKWIADGSAFDGAMIGFVCTRPEYRGQGIASALLNEAANCLREQRCDFAVLWTTLHSFYARLGWKYADTGVFGEVNLCPSGSAHDCIVATTLQEADTAWIEEVRTSLLPQRVPRSNTDYLCLPLAVDSIECYIINKPPMGKGYAIIGRKDAVGYLYEAAGGDLAFACIQDSIARDFDMLYVNESQESPYKNWLDQMALAKWQPQRQAMWLNISESLPDPEAQGWYIQYYDRI